MTPSFEASTGGDSSSNSTDSRKFRRQQELRRRRDDKRSILLLCGILFARAAVTTAAAFVTAPSRPTAAAQRVAGGAGAGACAWYQKKHHHHHARVDDGAPCTPAWPQPLGWGTLSASNLPANEDNNKDSSQDGDDNDETTRQPRKLDRFREWFSGSSEPSSPLVQMPGSGSNDGDGGVKDNQVSATSSPRGGNGGRNDDDDNNDDDDDDAWFAEERAAIINNYHDMLDGMLQQIEQERREDPDAVPSNAEAVVRSVVRQEMDAELRRTQEARERQGLRAYEQEQRTDADDVEDDALVMPTEGRVRELYDESEAEYARQEAAGARLDDFLRYEARAFAEAARQEKNANTATSASSSGYQGVQQPGEAENLDQWALERLKDMAQTRRDSEDEGDDMVLDNLDDNMEDLEQRMQREREQIGSAQHETMKEWQMYRAITTRLAETRDGEGGEEFAAAVSERLTSWKEYVVKEEGARKEGGLVRRGPKLPFRWQEADLANANRRPATEPRDGAAVASKADVRKQINKMSIEAMESLLINSDPARREKLQKEIDFLKSELESKDYLDFDEEEEDAFPKGPVDMSGVFTSSTEENAPTATVPARDISGKVAVDMAPPPRMPEVEESFSPPLPSAPNTPFFSSSSDDASYEDNVAVEDSKLGSMQEQKLQAMYRRAGARTREEQERIRSEWEDFQRLENSKREESGLSQVCMDEEGVSAPQTLLKYNVSDVMRDDGDFDADKILSSIGPRPVRRKKGASSDAASAQQSTGTNEDLDAADPSIVSDVDQKEVFGSLYRSVSAVGGGRWKDDPVEKAKDQAAYAEFLQMENNMRQSLDEQPVVKKDAESESTDSDTSARFDDEEYAEDALSSLGPRPKARRARRVDPGEFSDSGGVLGLREDGDLDDDLDDDEVPEQNNLSPQGGDATSVPDWLAQENAEKPTPTPRRRRRFLRGDDIEEAFDDNDYEKNMRQLAEYERRRNGGRDRQMGIDVGDIFGGRRDTEDYKDYKYDNDVFQGRRNGWGTATFATRKRDLLEYTELDVAELNNLMAHKDSVHSTGVSQYLPRINKPFKAFGAIFRLEGVLMDLTGLQIEAWKNTAESHGFDPPSFDDVRLAMVTQPEVAVKDVFVWTDDFIQCGKIAMTHRMEFAKVFDNWAKENGVSTHAASGPQSERGSLVLGEEVVEDPAQSAELTPTDEGEILELVAKAWTQTAASFSYPAPSEEQLLSSFSFAPDLAVRQVFMWTTDIYKVDEIVSVYRNTIKSLRGGSGQQNTSGEQLVPDMNSSPLPAQPASSSSPLVLDETSLMELHYHSWTQVAFMFGFEAPTTDEVLSAFVLNDPLIAVRDGYGWTSNPEQLQEVVAKFNEILINMIKERTTGGGATLSSPAKAPPADLKNQRSEVATETNEGPSYKDILQLHAQAWKRAADVHGFGIPTQEQVRLSMDMDSKDAVKRIMRWTGNDDIMQQTSEAFEKELKSLSDAFLRENKIKASPMQAESKEVVLEGPSADDVFQAAYEAWTATAKKHSFPLPEEDEVVFAMSVGLEDAIVSGFGWTQDPEMITKLLETYKAELATQRKKLKFQDEQVDADVTVEEIPPFRVNAGVAQWVKSLLDVEMECAIVSYLERPQVDVLLEQAGLSDLIGIDKRVTASNGYRRDSQQLLGAALRLERRPDHCVVFDSSPYASVAAHDVEMRSVGLIDPYPRYELLSADSTASGFGELTAMNIRRLFGERIYDQPMMDMQQTQPNVQKKQKTKYFWDDD